MKRTSVALIFTLIVSVMMSSLAISIFLYEVFDFIIPIRTGGVWGLTLGCVISWGLFLSLRSRFPKVQKSGSEVKVIRARNPLPPVIAARVSVLALSITRTSSLLLGLYAGIGFWAAMRLQVDYKREVAELSLISGLLSIMILIAGLVLERLCSPPSGDGVIDAKQAT